MTWRLTITDTCETCNGECQSYDGKVFTDCPDCGGKGHYEEREMTADEAVEHLLERIEALEERLEAKP